MSDPSSRSITISVKVNRHEWAVLRAYGSTPGKGLRRLIDKHLSKRRWQEEAWEVAEDLSKEEQA